MKRTDMLDSIKKLLDAGRDWADVDTRAENLLASLEQLGMMPPHVSHEDTQAIMNVYYGGYSLYQWDEDLEKDEQVQSRKKMLADGAEQRRLKYERRRLEREKK